MLNLIQIKSEDLDKHPDSLEELKFVLTTISDIKNMSLDVENRMRLVQERYRVLAMYDLKVSTGSGGFSKPPK